MNRDREQHPDWYDDEDAFDRVAPQRPAPGKATLTMRIGRPALQRKTAAPGKVSLTAGLPGSAGVALDRAARSPGQPLPTELRARLENTAGADLRAVRVHSGRESAEAAVAVRAKAYTFGTDIHFAAGQYDPSSERGQRLIAHEVAHTVQQREAGSLPQGKPEASVAGDAAELEADSFADAFTLGRRAPAPTQRPQRVVQREEATSSELSRAGGALGRGAKAASKGLHVDFNVMGVDVTGDFFAAEVAAKQDGPTLGHDVLLSHAKADMLARSAATSFLRGKRELEHFKKVFVDIEGSLVETKGPSATSGDGASLEPLRSRNLGILNVKLKVTGKIMEVVEGGAKVELSIKGTLTLSALDSKDLVELVNRATKRLKELEGQIDQQAERIRKLKARSVKLREQRAVLEKRYRASLAKRPKHLSYRLYGERLDVERAIALDKEEIARLGKAQFDNLREIDKLTKNAGGWLRRARNKGSQALAKALGVVFKNALGRAVLKVLPVLGWIAAASELPEWYAILRRLLRGEIGFMGTGGDQRRGSGGGGGDGSGDHAGEPHGDGGDGETPVEQGSPDATNRRNENPDESDPERVSGGKQGGQQGREGTRGASGEDEHTGTGGGGTGEDGAGGGDEETGTGGGGTGQGGAEPEPGDEIAREGDVVAREGERAAEPGETHAREGDIAAGYGDEAARGDERDAGEDDRGDEQDGREAAPVGVAEGAGEQGEGHATSGDGSVGSSGAEARGATGQAGGSSTSVTEAVDAPKEESLWDERTTLPPTEAELRARDAEHHGGRHPKPRRPSQRDLGTYDRETAYKLGPSDFETVVRVENGKARIADRATVARWKQTTQPERERLGAGATARILNVHVEQTSDESQGASETIYPCRLTLTVEITPAGGGSKIVRAESWSFYYSPSGQVMLPTANVTASLREALRTGKQSFSLPGLDLAIREIDQERGRVYVRVTGAAGVHRVRNADGQLEVARRNAVIALPLPVTE